MFEREEEIHWERAQLRGRRWGEEEEEEERRNRNNKQKEGPPRGNKGKEGHLDQISQRGQLCQVSPGPY